MKKNITITGIDRDHEVTVIYEYKEKIIDNGTGVPIFEESEIIDEDSITLFGDIPSNYDEETEEYNYEIIQELNK